DVIHSFWVPEFRVKQDAIPGMTTELRITPTQLGTYKLRCAELCGLDHAAMIAGVEVVSREAFDAWTAQMAVAAAAATTPEAIGERLYTEAGCVACHSIDGSAGVGPTWLGLLGRTENLDDGSTVTVDEAYLRASILNPGEQIVSGFTNVMPANIAADMTAEQIDALIAYIQTLESGN
ncbi:MAG: c-type cytochrome, partial [Anaerolineales bacterium]